MPGKENSMTIETIMIIDRSDDEFQIFNLIKESMSRSKWKTGSVQRKYNERFNDHKQDIINKHRRLANNRTARVSVYEFKVLKEFADFLAEVM